MRNFGSKSRNELTLTKAGASPSFRKHTDIPILSGLFSPPKIKKNLKFLAEMDFGNQRGKPGHEPKQSTCMRTKPAVHMKYLYRKKLLRNLKQNMPERIVGIPGYISSVTRMHGSKVMSN